MIFFSVIIPTYNRAHLVAETVDTVLQQTYSHFEVIIVDDGSTDNTGPVIRQKYGADARVKYFYKQNEERGAARNFGLQQAKGDYAVFFDSDDRMLPHYLETLNQTIAVHPGIFLLAAKYNYNNQGKTEIHPELQPLADGWYNRNFFLKGNMLACNYCVRIKDRAYRFFPEERELASMEDWLFLLQNLDKEKIFIRNKICVTMMQHPERSMSNNQRVIAARIKAKDWALGKLQLSGKEKKILVAWSHYFCGIHQYLDYNRGASVKESMAAIRTGGIHKKFLFLLAKSIAGRKLTTAFR
jgi:GalNAc5-diNAcBac-PP-undecaprenol beta-1,3-glucosyltransferase